MRCPLLTCGTDLRSCSQELADLKRAAHGSTADKILYFDNCVRRRLQEMHTAEPTGAAPFTWEQKRKLSVACCQLDEGHCGELLELVAKLGGKDASGDGEILVDLELLPDAALAAIQVRACCGQCPRSWSCTASFD